MIIHLARASTKKKAFPSKRGHSFDSRTSLPRGQLAYLLQSLAALAYTMLSLQREANIPHAEIWWYTVSHQSYSKCCVSPKLPTLGVLCHEATALNVSPEVMPETASLWGWSERKHIMETDGKKISKDLKTRKKIHLQANIIFHDWFDQLISKWRWTTKDNGAWKLHPE